MTKKATLEIVITHWKEPLCDCEKLFQSLAIQRGISTGDCRVTVVQDGDEGKLDIQELMTRYPFILRVIEIRHGGVSAARNAGMDAAEAEWIMFCDCDDLFYGCESVKQIIRCAEDAEGKADILYGSFLTENRDKNGKWTSTVNGWNTVFIHAKIWRLEWLKEKKIRFQEGLAFSEDQLFNATAALEVDPERVGRIPATVYLWCLRAGSCTSDRENDPRNRDHAITRRRMMPEICTKRGKTDSAIANAVRGILDSYHELTVLQIPEDEKKALERRVQRELIGPWGWTLEKISREDYAKITKVSRESVGKRYRDAERPTLEEWMTGLKEKYGR